LHTLLIALIGAKLPALTQETLEVADKEPDHEKMTRICNYNVIVAMESRGLFLVLPKTQAVIK